MNRILSSAAAEAVADVFRKAFSLTGPKDNTTAPADPNSPAPSQPPTGVLVFIGHLLANPALSKLFAGADSEAAVLSGSLIGLASGVDAVTDENNAVKSEAREHPLRSALTICAYVVAGIAAAMIYRGIRRNTQANPA